MGHIKAPKGVDLLVSPMPLSAADLAGISLAISEYRRTGKLPSKKQEIAKKVKQVNDKKQHAQKATTALK
jgi:hypothetical protein